MEQTIITKATGEQVPFNADKFRHSLKRSGANEETINAIISEVQESLYKGIHFMIECKFHNRCGYVSDVKIPLYIQARFKDVEQQWKKIDGHETKFHQGWVVTNTKFTTDAIQYGLCAGLHLVGWDFPKNKSLREQIDASGLYPLTCLTTLTLHEKQLLLDADIVLCMELCRKPELLSIAHIPAERSDLVMNEANVLCKGVHA